MWITSIGRHGAVAGISERRPSSCSSCTLLCTRHEIHNTTLCLCDKWFPNLLYTPSLTSFVSEYGIFAMIKTPLQLEYANQIHCTWWDYWPGKPWALPITPTDTVGIIWLVYHQPWYGETNYRRHHYWREIGRLYVLARAPRQEVLVFQSRHILGPI